MPNGQNLYVYIITIYCVYVKNKIQYIVIFVIFNNFFDTLYYNLTNFIIKRKEQ